MSEHSGYIKVWQKPLLDTAEIRYYSCRAPDGNYCLLAECQNDLLPITLEKLQERQQRYLESLGMNTGCNCQHKSCQRQRECLQINFLPSILDKITDAANHYVLDYACFDFGEMIMLDPLLEACQIDALSVCRIMMSLIILIDRLVRWRIEAKLTMENLLLSPKASYVTLLDWSSARAVRDLKTSTVVSYYQQLGKITAKLLDAEQSGEHWQIEARPRNQLADRLLIIAGDLQKLEFKITDIDKVAETIRGLDRQIAGILQKFCGLCSIVRVKELAPPLQISQRQKKEE